MTQRLHRNLTGPDALQPGEYATSIEPHITATMVTVTVCCPLCGGKKQLGSGHVVARDGRVTPAFACAHCPFMEWIELSDWGAIV